MAKKKQTPNTPLQAMPSMVAEENPTKPLFNKGDKIIASIGNLVVKDVSVEAVVEKMKSITGATIDHPQTYIIEHPNGWTPNHIRASKYGLDINKKYLFVKEKQLTAQ